jgi:hypothetical protein
MLEIKRAGSLWKVLVWGKTLVSRKDLEAALEDARKEVLDATWTDAGRFARGKANKEEFAALKTVFGLINPDVQARLYEANSRLKARLYQANSRLEILQARISQKPKLPEVPPVQVPPRVMVIHGD